MEKEIKDLKDIKDLKEFKMDLQLFSDFFGEGGAPDIPNPILADTDVSDSEPTTNTSESDNDTTNIHTHSTDTDIVTMDVDINTGEPIGKPNLELDGIKSQLDNILNTINKPTQEEIPFTEEPKEPTQEEIDKMNNDFYMDFTDKPLDVLNKLIEEKANEKVAPIKAYFDNMQQMQHWNNQISEFEKANPDFRDNVNEIADIIQNNEGIRNSQNPLELAYKLAKADKLMAKTAETSIPIEEQIKNTETLKSLLGNQGIKSLIVNELKATKDDIPTVIGSDGSTSVNVGDKPKSMAEATKAWLNS